MAETRARWRESLLVGVLVFGTAGMGAVLLIIAGVIRLIRPDGNLSDLLEPTILACAATAAALVGTIAWRSIAGAPDAGPRRGALAGLVVGLLSHPLCWFLLTAYQVAGNQELRGRSALDTASGLVFMTTWISFSSLGLLGWITAPLGAALGYATRRITASKPVVSPPGEPQ